MQFEAPGRPYRIGMDSIRADVEGLRALASSCMHHATAIRNPDATPVHGGEIQATAAAIAAAHAEVDLMERNLAGRLVGTAYAAARAAQGFASTEASNRQRLAEVAV